MVFSLKLYEIDTIWIQKFKNFWPMNLYEIDTTCIQKFEISDHSEFPCKLMGLRKKEYIKICLLVSSKIWIKNLSD